MIGRSTAPATDPFEAYLDRAAAGDVDGAFELLMAEIDRGRAVPEVMEAVVCAAQVEVGERWGRGEWTVAQEHLATAVAEGVIARLGHEFARPATNGELTLTCVEGEWHSLAARVTAEVLRMDGWVVHCLGPSTPAGELVAHLHERGPRAVGVSCAMPVNLPGARRVIETIRSTGTPVLAGGRGFGPDDRWARLLGANAWAPRSSDAPMAIDGLPEGVSPAPELDHPRRAEYELVHGKVVPIAAAIVRRLADELSDGADERVLDDVPWLLRALLASLLVDDRRIVDDWFTWAEATVATAGPATVDALADMVAIAGEELPEGAATARAWLASAGRVG